MKWYFAISESSLGFTDHGWPDLLRVSVKSAIRNTTLEPILLYDGQPNDLTRELADLGVTVIQHRVGFYKQLADYAIGTNKPEGWIRIASGAFLRFDIPVIEKTDDLVLYTDSDVLFLKNPEFFGNLPPTYFAAAPQFGEDYADMNSGVMLINVPAMRYDYENLVRFTTANLDIGLDQEILRVRYANCYDLLDRTLNWKPYWGQKSDAQIVHFHGPKPVTARMFLDNPGHLTHDSWSQLLSMNQEGYRHYVGLWEQYSGAKAVVCTVDEISHSRLRGWVFNPNDRDQIVTLTLIVNGAPIVDVICELSRPDVKEAGYGSDKAGFDIQLDPALLKPGSHEVWFADAHGELVDLFMGGQKLERLKVEGVNTSLIAEPVPGIFSSQQRLTVNG